VLVAFLDDCRPASGWIARGGLIVEGDRLLELECAFSSILREAGIPIDDPSLDTEVKWSPRPGNWIRECYEGDRTALYRRLLGVVSTYKVSLLAAVFNYADMDTWDEDHAYGEGFVYTFERVQFCAEAAKTPAIVICDNETDRKSTQDRVSETFALVKSGSRYVPLNNIYGHAWAVDSRRHAGIQLADLVVGITGCMVAGKQHYAAKLWPLLQGQFAWLKKLRREIPQRWGLSILPKPLLSPFIKEWNPYGW